MTTTRWPSARHRTAILATLLSITLIGLPILNPDAAQSGQPNPFANLRKPGETGFVASHRGDKHGAPENTLEAMRLALLTDAEFVETDLQLTADGVPVLMHDWTVDRTTDGSGPVWSHTWKQLSALDAGSWYSAAFRGARVPRLDEFLDLVGPSEKRIILELKGSWTAEQLRPVAAEIASRRLDHRVLFASFDIVSLANLADVAPDLARAVIARQVVGDPAILAGTCGAIAIVTSRSFIERDPQAVTRIHEAGLGVLLYTLNDEAMWSDAIALGVDGIITDRPNQLDEWLGAETVGVAFGG